MNRGDRARAWLRPAAALAGLIGAIAAAVQGQWLPFAIYLAVFLAFTALTVLMLRDLRARRTN